MNRRLTAVAALVGACAVALGSCAGNGNGSDTDSSAPAAVTQAPAETASTAAPEETTPADGPRIVTDHSGAEVVVPSQINRVALEQIPLMSTYVAYFDGEAPYLVAASERLVNMMDETIITDIAPEALEVDTSFDDQGTINAETLLGLSPDIVLNNARNMENRGAMEAVGMTVVGFETLGAPTDTYVKWFRQLEEVFGEPGKMDEKIAYGDELINDAEARAAAVPDDERRTAIVVMAANPGMLAVAGGQPGWFTEGWATTMNFTSLTAEDARGQMPVNLEQLLDWDPDVIFVAGKGMSSMTAAEILNNEVEGLDLSSLRAVQNGEVYSTELGMWNWFTPNPDAPVVANWLGSRLYPDQFADVDLVQMTRDYYEVVYDHELTEERATLIVDPDVDLR
ncbi:MAG TPA: ABC transporter substrate-binding protein [Actinomycetaceae bacterium]|nr:ABC transporter substrate-binding protein [Actinomycetaceae bacterium]